MVPGQPVQQPVEVEELKKELDRLIDKHLVEVDHALVGMNKSDLATIKGNIPYYNSNSHVIKTAMMSIFRYSIKILLYL